MSLLLLLKTPSAAGLTTYRQFALGATQYGTGTHEGLLSLDWIPGQPQVITHVVSLSTVHPQKWLGRGPAHLVGVMQLQAANLLTFLSALNVTSSRAANWVWHSGTEVYCMVGAATHTTERFTSQYGAAATTKLVRVSFDFECGDQRLYQASNSAVLLGG